MGDVRRLTVFDLDGTLVDSRRDLANSANALILERGGRPLDEEAIGRMVGDGAAALVRRALEAAGLPTDEASLPRFLELYDERLLQTTSLYPGTLDVVRTLAAEMPVAVLTNKPLAPSLRILEALGLLPFVSETIGGDGPFPRKPDPGGLRHLMAGSRSDPSRTVLVGDSRIDLATARAAGCHACLARYGYGFELLPVEELTGREALVDAARELPAAIRRLLAATSDGR